MSYRTKLLLAFVVTVIVTVGTVAITVLQTTRRAFEQTDRERTAALVQQFEREFERRGEEIARRVDGIAESEATLRMAIDLSTPQADPSRYLNDASGLAVNQQLDFLELIANDGSLISSAQWPMRFGYRNEWVTQPVNWNQQGAFLKAEELPQETALALVAVREVRVADRRLYVVGGKRLDDQEFLSSIPLPGGMRVLLYRHLSEGFQPDALTGAKGPVENAAKLASLIESVRREAAAPQQGRKPSSFVQTVQWSASRASAETFHAIPRMGRDGELLAVLLVGSARAPQVYLENFIRNVSLGVAGGGILLGLLLSWWASARVTRPIQQLAEGAKQVAAGNWSANVPVRSRDEVGQLGRAFNQMTTQLSEQRDRLVQSERVAAWRELARRLAHELKNPLFPLQLTVENLQRARAQDLHEFDLHFREGTAALLAEIQNLKNIINRFADFARMPAPELHPVDLNQVVRAVVRLYEPQFSAVGRPPITPELYLDEDLETIQADPELLHRALSNLVLNALDAMPSGGTIAIRTQRHGDGVYLEIADTGTGLTREECERLFTPYYTSKQHGTGLGLAIVQAVVSDHGGKIWVRSEPGHGTTFSIELPVRPPAPHAEPLARKQEAAVSKPIAPAPPWPEPAPAKAPKITVEPPLPVETKPEEPDAAFEPEPALSGAEALSKEAFPEMPSFVDAPDQAEVTAIVDDVESGTIEEPETPAMPPSEPPAWAASEAVERVGVEEEPAAEEPLPSPETLAAPVISSLVDDSPLELPEPQPEIVDATPAEVPSPPPAGPTPPWHPPVPEKAQKSAHDQEAAQSSIYEQPPWMEEPKTRPRPVPDTVESLLSAPLSQDELEQAVRMLDRFQHMDPSGGNLPEPEVIPLPLLESEPAAEVPENAEESAARIEDGATQDTLELQAQTEHVPDPAEAAGAEPEVATAASASPNGSERSNGPEPAAKEEKREEEPPPKPAPPRRIFSVWRSFTS